MSTQGASVILKPGSKQTIDMTTGVAWRGTLRAALGEQASVLM